MSHEGPIIKPKTVDEWLNGVDYELLNNGNYMPSSFSLNYMNFVKLVNGEDGEENKTPVAHLKMLDEVPGPEPRIANLCARGMAKTSLFFEYFAPYVAVFEEIEGFGEVSGMIYVSDSMENGVAAARKNLEYRYRNSSFLQHYLPHAHFTDKYIEFGNRNDHLLGIKLFGAKTGLRGTKIFAKRPTIAVLDDLVSDDDARSPTAMASIKDTVYKGIGYALNPLRRKIIFNGTPFNKNDVLYEAVESGAWKVNVFPICERFPCSKEEFRGAWEDRFSYEYIKAEYEMSVKTGKVAAFMQELMLRITPEEERLVLDHEIRWYSRKSLLENKHKFNFYMTTDFAMSEKQKADMSVMSIWAYNANRDWFWVDGMVGRESMAVVQDRLFDLVATYHPQQVGVEVTGQQGGFISLFQREMMNRNIWFNFATGSNNQPGIRPQMNKLARFNLMVPYFKAGKMFFPEELKSDPRIQEFMSQISMATMNGFKSKHDDCLDNISMLGDLKPWIPDTTPTITPNEDGVWSVEGDNHDDGSINPISSYIV